MIGLILQLVITAVCVYVATSQQFDINNAPPEILNLLPIGIGADLLERFKAENKKAGNGDGSKLNIDFHTAQRLLNEAQQQQQRLPTSVDNRLQAPGPKISAETLNRWASFAFPGNNAKPSVVQSLGQSIPETQNPNARNSNNQWRPTVQSLPARNTAANRDPSTRFSQPAPSLRPIGPAQSGNRALSPAQKAANQQKQRNEQFRLKQAQQRNRLQQQQRQNQNQQQQQQRQNQRQRQNQQQQNLQQNQPQRQNQQQQQQQNPQQRIQTPVNQQQQQRNFQLSSASSSSNQRPLGPSTNQRPSSGLVAASANSFTPNVITPLGGAAPRPNSQLQQPATSRQQPQQTFNNIQVRPSTNQNQQRQQNQPQSQNARSQSQRQQFPLQPQQNRIPVPPLPNTSQTQQRVSGQQIFQPNQGSPQAPEITNFQIKSFNGNPSNLNNQRVTSSPYIPPWAAPNANQQTQNLINPSRGQNPAGPIVPSIVNRPQAAANNFLSQLPSNISPAQLQAAFPGAGIPNNFAFSQDLLNSLSGQAQPQSRAADWQNVNVGSLPNIGIGGGSGIFDAVLNTLSGGGGAAGQNAATNGGQLAQVAQLAAANPQLISSFLNSQPQQPAAPANGGLNIDLVGRILEMGLSNILGAPQLAPASAPNKDANPSSAQATEDTSQKVPYYGAYCGKFDKSTGDEEHNCQGALWAANETLLMVSHFSFKPRESENISFWIGPAVQTGDSSVDLFPSANGLYVKPLKFSRDARSTPGKVIIAKMPKTDQLSEIFKKAQKQPKTEKDESKDEKATDAAAEPEPEPSPEGRRRRRNTYYQNFMDTFVPRPRVQYEPKFVERSISTSLGASPRRSNQQTVKLIVDQGQVSVPQSQIFGKSSSDSGGNRLTQNGLNDFDRRQPLDPLGYRERQPVRSNVVDSRPVSSQRIDIEQSQADRTSSSVVVLTGDPTSTTIATRSSTTTQPTTTTTRAPVKIEPLQWHNAGPPLMLALPHGYDLNTIRWLSVFDHEKQKSIASVLVPNGPGFSIPRTTMVKGLESTGFKDVRSGKIEIVDEKTIRIHDFFFEGDAPGAWFMVGKNFLPNPFGDVVPVLTGQNEDGSPKYDCDFIKPHNTTTVTLRLPGTSTVRDVFWLSLFCVPYSISFAHVYLPYKDLRVPPDFSGETVPRCQLEEA